MRNLRALGRSPVHFSVYVAGCLAASLLLPVAAGASTGSHESKAQASVAVRAQATAYIGSASRKTRAQARSTARPSVRPARQRPSQPSREATQATLPSGLDLLLGRLAGSSAAVPRANITCAAPGGNWSSATTWTGGAIPTATDDVTIGSGCAVTVDAAAAALDVTVSNGGTLQYEDATARTLTVGANVTVDTGGTFQSAATGAQTGHGLSVGANLVNQGTIDFSTNGDTAGASITFTGAGNATLNNSGTLDLRGVTLNKGTSSASMLDFQPGGTITVQGANASGFLTITNGTFKISGTGALTSPVFASATYTIPATGAFWLNDANATVVGQVGNPTNNGLLRVSDGTLNVGTLGTHVMGAGAGAAFSVEGGTANFAGRLASTNAFVTYRQSGGTVNTCVAGGCATAPSFGFTGTTGVVTKLSGGSINLVQANTAATPVDYNETGTMVYTGGTPKMGTPATATKFLFPGPGPTPHLVLDNTTKNKKPK